MKFKIKIMLMVLISPEITVQCSTAGVCNADTSNLAGVERDLVRSATGVA